LSANPARGRRTVTRDELKEKWSGFAAVASPTERLANAPRGGLDLSWLVPFIKPYRGKLVLATLLALAAAGVQMLFPVFSQVIIDRVLPQHDQSLLLVIAAAMVGLIALAVAITITQRWILARMAALLDADTVEFISDRLLRLPMRYFESRRTGDIQRRLAGLQQVRSVPIQSGIAGLTAATQFVVALVIMFTYSLC
jgi:ATP-binding cassette subfamily B protein